MNIFLLSWDVKKCAEYHCDKHVVKMILESAQLLCSPHWVLGSEAPYKLAHKNHPCTIWVRNSFSNYNYLCDLGLSLCEEYTFRYDKKHKSEEVILWCKNNPPNIEDKGITFPALAMPEQYKTSDPIVSYRNFYNGEKSSFAQWKKRKVPEWFSKVEVNQ